MENIILIEKNFLLFMTYAIAGWCMEEIHCSIREKKIVDRGFLIGPVCPIYGFGGLGITIFLTKFSNSPITVFCMGVILCAVLEYFTSYFMEKIFNARWWDYSKEKLNLNGRICIRTLIPFGIFGVLVIYLFNPYLNNAFETIPLTGIHIISISLATILLLDFIISMNVVSQVTSKAKRISINNPRDNTEEITEKVKEELRKTLTGKRLVDAYPDFEAFASKIKEIAEKAVADTAEKGKKAVKATAQKSKEAVEKGKERVTYTVRRGKVVTYKAKKKIKHINSKLNEKNK